MLTKAEFTGPVKIVGKEEESKAIYMESYEEDLGNRLLEVFENYYIPGPLETDPGGEQTHVLSGKFKVTVERIGT